MQQHNYVPAPLNRRRGPKARLPEQRRIGVWFVGARANNPSLNWFQDQLLQVQSTDPRYRVDLRVLFSNTPDELPRNLAGERLDGVIVQGMEPSADCLAKLRELPHVWFMTRRSVSYPGDYVEPNNEENGRMAAEYLHERGHKAVAVITTARRRPSAASCCPGGRPTRTPTSARPTTLPTETLASILKGGHGRPFYWRMISGTGSIS